jgi:fibrillarin-like pre-rRNA processing protein
MTEAEKNAKNDKILTLNRRLYTQNVVPGKKVYGEELKKFEGRSYRDWNPKRSKWAAAIKKNMDVVPGLRDNILYLGASTGTTVSHLADLTEGIIFAVENSAEMAIPLVRLSEKRENIAPVFCDARNVDSLKKATGGMKIDILFQDIPSLDQVRILENASELVDGRCRILLSLKTQSISQQDPDTTMREVSEKLKDKFEILQSQSLEPWHKKHYFFVLKKK